MGVPHLLSVERSKNMKEVKVSPPGRPLAHAVTFYFAKSRYDHGLDSLIPNGTPDPYAKWVKNRQESCFRQF